jgi:DNA ligase-1
MLVKKEAKHYELYKKDSKGKIRFLIIDTDDNKVTQKSGIVGGAEVQNDSYCKGKNIGRANETSPVQQAKLVAKAKYDKKLKEGYFKTQAEAENNEVILPMLAKVYGKESHKIDWTPNNVFVQCKYDGMRCLAIMKNGNITLMSRSGNEITTMEHIKTELMSVYEEGVVLDGELYAHGLSFQENMKLCKKYRPGETEKVKYVVYDSIEDMPFLIRFDKLTEMDLNKLQHVQIAPTFETSDEEDLMLMHEKNLNLGYEGTIVRVNTDAGYKVNGRSSDLLKLKDFHDLAVELIDVEESEKRPGYGKPIFHWPGAENDRLGAGVALDHRMCQDLLTNKDKYIGKTGELRFFEYSDTGVPRHPVLHGFRLDK